MITKTKKSTLIKLKYVLVLVSAMMWLNASAQDNKNKTKDESFFIQVEEMPMFPGGEAALFKFIGDNIAYPEKSRKAKISGKVYIEFIVSDKGKINNAKVLKSISEDIDAEALRVINSMPDWVPGKQNGRFVNVSFKLPINFRLNN